MFVGRKKELEQLALLQKKGSASLVCVMGRRRIGKSALIAEFGKKNARFINIQGLGPDKGLTQKQQLEHFSEEVSLQFNTKKEYYDSWIEAFDSLYKKTKRGKFIILLDEISWMGRGSLTFPLVIKDAWDTRFKNNKDLILVLCGSVSSWIQENILKNASFEGRISLEIKLEELAISEIYEYWSKKEFHMGINEILQILLVAGGVPKYLEEIIREQSSDQNLTRLCFQKSGILFNDFEKIFIDILGKSSPRLEKIIRLCMNEKLSPAQLAKKMNTDLDSDFSRALQTLELSGFLSRDFYFSPSGKTSKLNHLRVSDNYLRFYLNFIEPKKNFILRGGKSINSLAEIKNWSAIMGLQFENIILKNRDILLKILELKDSQIISAAPYVQRKKSNNKGACQIDLLIHTEFDVFYLCEFKCRKEIEKTVVIEVQKKMDILQLSRRSSIKPVLVYHGELRGEAEEKILTFFHRCISFSELYSFKI